MYIVKMAYDNDQPNLNAKIYFQNKFFQDLKPTLFYFLSQTITDYLSKLSPAPYISVGMQNTFV